MTAPQNLRKDMKHLSRYPLLLLLTAALSCAEDGLDLKTWNAYRNPLVLSAVPNPDILKEGDTWYLYSDAAAEDEVISLMSSTDLVTWGRLDPLFDEDTKPSFIVDGTVSGPSVIKVGEQYLLYYSLRKTDEECGIGVASSATPTGPWIDHGALLLASVPDLTALCHPFVFESDGSLSLAFAAADGIYLLPLSPTGLSPAGEPVRIVEGPVSTPVLFQESGRWYLLSTTGSESGDASSTAVITVCSAQTLTGPYGEWKKLIGRGTKFAGPGSPSRLVRDSEGNDWLLYNAFDLSDLSSGRTLMLDRLHWDGNDVPWVRGSASSFYTDAPHVQLN